MKNYSVHPNTHISPKHDLFFRQRKYDFPKFHLDASLRSL